MALPPLPAGYTAPDAGNPPAQAAPTLPQLPKGYSQLPKLPAGYGPAPEAAPERKVITPPDILPGLKPLINKYAEQFKLNPKQLEYMLDIESSGGRDPGKAGIAQFTDPATAKQYGVTNPNDIEQNVRGMAHYVSDLMKRFGNDPIKAAQAYNMGPTAYQTHLDTGVPFPQETQDYATKYKNKEAEAARIEQTQSVGRPPGPGNAPAEQPGFPNPHQDDHTSVAQQTLDATKAASQAVNRGLYHPGNVSYVKLQEALQAMKDNPVQTGLNVLGTGGRAVEQIVADATNELAEHKSPSQIVADAAHYFTTPASMSKVLHAMADPKQTEILAHTIETHLADSMGMPHPDKWNPIFKVVADILVEGGLDPVSYVPISTLIKPIQAAMELAGKAGIGAGIMNAVHKASGNGVIGDAVKRTEDWAKTLPKIGKQMKDYVTDVRPDLNPHYTDESGKLVHMSVEDQAGDLHNRLKAQADAVLEHANKDPHTAFDNPAQAVQDLKLDWAYRFGDLRASKAAAKMMQDRGMKLPEGPAAQNHIKFAPKFIPKPEKEVKLPEPPPERKTFVDDSVNQAMEEYDLAHPEQVTAAEKVKAKYGKKAGKVEKTVSPREKYRQMVEAAAVQQHDKLLADHSNEAATLVKKLMKQRANNIDKGVDLSKFVEGYRDLPNPARKIEGGFNVPGKGLDEAQLGPFGKGFLDSYAPSVEELTHAAGKSEYEVLSAEFESMARQIRNGSIANAMAKIYSIEPGMFSAKFHSDLLNSAVTEQTAHIKDVKQILALEQEIKSDPTMVEKLKREQFVDHFRNNVPYRPPTGVQAGGTAGQVLEKLRGISDLWKGSMEGTGLVAHSMRNVGSLAYLVGSSPMVAAKGFMYGMKGLDEKQLARMVGNGSRTTFWRETPEILKNLGVRMGLGAGVGAVGGAFANDPHSDPTKRFEDIAGNAFGGAALGAALPQMAELMDRFENGFRFSRLEDLDRKLGPAKNIAEEYRRGATVSKELGGYTHSTALVNVLKGMGGTFVAYRLGTVPRAFFSAAWDKTGRVTNALRAEENVANQLPGNKGKNIADQPVRMHALGGMEEGPDMLGDAAGVGRFEVPKVATSASTVGLVPAALFGAIGDAYYVKTHVKSLKDTAQEAAYSGLEVVPGGTAISALNPSLSPYKNSSGLPFWAQELMSLTGSYTTAESKFTKKSKERNARKVENQKL